jgi:hypothetical protein
MPQRRFKPRLLVGRYRSKSEERVAEHLNFLGVPYLYEPKDGKVTYKIERSASYLPDFVLTKSGTILEVKGYLTSSDRSKYIRIKESNPNIDLRFVFDRASTKLNKTSKTTYAEWADKHGFLWCEKVIPPHWYSTSNRKSNERASSKAAGTKGSASPRKVKPQSHGGLGRLRYLPSCRQHS